MDQKNNNKKTYDPEVDPCNSQFDPEKALSAKHTPLTKNPKIFDNIQVLKAAALRINNRVDQQLLSEGLFVRRREKEPDTEPTETRRFLSHQALVETKPKISKNLLTRIETGYEGPLGSLKKLMNENVRVKVYVRKEHGVRGTVTGFIEAFDKHWNIAIRNVEETWRRRKTCVSESNVKFDNTVPKDVAQRKLQRMGIKMPEITKIKSIDRKYVEITRKVPQLLIRGEQIVLVIRLES